MRLSRGAHWPQACMLPAVRNSNVGRPMTSCPARLTCAYIGCLFAVSFQGFLRALLVLSQSHQRNDQ